VINRANIGFEVMHERNAHRKFWVWNPVVLRRLYR
jgi:hypothetical protein